MWLAENPLETQRSSDSGAARSRLERVMTAPSQRCEEEQGPCGAALVGWGVSDMCKGGGCPPSLTAPLQRERENPVAEGDKEIWSIQRWARAGK